MKTVKCPNLCFNGKDKVHDFEKALFTLVTCKFCGGRGKVSEEEAKIIESKL